MHVACSRNTDSEIHPIAESTNKYLGNKVSKKNAEDVLYFNRTSTFVLYVNHILFLCYILLSGTYETYHEMVFHTHAAIQAWGFGATTRWKPTNDRR
jgi:hypothetical protein